ncbi:unnamed protein product, partial [Prorocentrum cordatum]
MRRECTVVQVDMNRVRVHYEGFDSSRDEWLPKDSNRIVANQQQQVQNQGQAVPSPPQSPHSMQQPGQGVGMPGQQLAAQPAGPEFLVGSKITVLSPSGMRRECTVVQVDMHSVRIHYEGFRQLPRRVAAEGLQPHRCQSTATSAESGTGCVFAPAIATGFDSSRDEWLPEDSHRIVANQQQAPQNQGQAGAAHPPSPQPMQQPGQGVGMPGQQLAAQPAGPEFLVGSKITVLSPSGMRRECTVVQVDMNRVMVHYEGFDSSRDEWLPKNSNRIVANQQQQMQNQGQAVHSSPQSPHSMQQPGQGVGMPGQQLAAQPAGPEFLVGSKITVLSPSGVRRECTVVQVDMNRVRVHYEGFDSSRDEWLPKGSNRIVASSQASQPMQQLVPQAPAVSLAVGTKIVVFDPSNTRRECFIVEAAADKV